MTRYPALSSTVTAALAVLPGSRWLLNVSGHSTTAGRVGSDERGACRRANQSWNVSAANSGTWRWLLKPASAWRPGPRTGARITAFTHPDARLARRAHQNT